MYNLVLSHTCMTCLVGQVVQESGSEADTTYKKLLSKMDMDVLDAAYESVEDLIAKVNKYVRVCKWTLPFYYFI